MPHTGGAALLTVRDEGATIPYEERRSQDGMVRELGMLIDTLLHEEICCLLGASDFEWY